MRRLDWRHGVVWLFILAMAGVSVYFLFLADSGEPATTPTPSPSATAGASPTISPTSPTPTPTESATPLPDYTPTELPIGDDFLQVVQTIYNIRHDAFTTGDATILGEIYDSRCTCSTGDQEAIRLTRDDGYAYEGGVPSVESVEVDTVNDEGGPDDVILDATISFTKSSRLRPDGTVANETAPRTIVLRMALLRGMRSDQRWIALAADRIE